MKYMGVDYGEKNVGIALSDDGNRMAFPHSVLTNTKSLIDEIVALAKTEKVQKIVMGESKDFEGNENPIMKRIHPLVQKLEEAKMSVEFESEMFSSAASERMPHRQTSGEEVYLDKNDAGAATIILQSYLDKLEQNHGRED